MLVSAAAANRAAARAINPNQIQVERIMSLAPSVYGGEVSGMYVREIIAERVHFAVRDYPIPSPEGRCDQAESRVSPYASANPIRSPAA